MIFKDENLCRILNELEALIEKPLPDDYLVFDIETTGLSFIADFPYEVTMLPVRRGRPAVRYISIYVDWSNLIGRTVYEKLMHEANARFKRDGLDMEIPVSDVIYNGVDYREAIRMIIGELSKLQEPWIVAHNGYGFDIPFMRSVINNVVPRSEESDKLMDLFKTGLLIDTGLIEKARQVPVFVSSVLHELDRLDPETSSPGQRLNVFWTEVRDTYASVKWSLHNHCLNVYNLDKYGLRPEDYHKAYFDAYATFYLYETMKSACTNQNKAEEVLLTEELSRSG